MAGTWTRTIDGTLVGKGTFARGAGSWTSFYPDGGKRAEGSYVGDRPHGWWRLYHASGNLAAVGELRRGVRHGSWQFFYDTRARTPIAVGQFGGPGTVVGTWRHYDAAGELLATTRPAGKGPDPTSRGAVLMSIVPRRDRGVVHEISATGGMGAAQLHFVARGRERLYVEHHGGIYDADGHQLVRDGDHWLAAPCRWSKRRKAIAAAGDVTTLHRLLAGDRAEACGDPKPVSQARARSIERTLGALAELRAPSPAFVRELVLGHGTQLSDLAAVNVPDGDRDDLARLLAASLAWYIEWPHLDGQFVELFPTIAGAALDDELWAQKQARNPTAD